MHFNTGSVIFLGISALSNVASAQTIAFGQQIQNDDNTNHWTVWRDKTDNPCRVEQVLSELTTEPCDQPFFLGALYSFSACTGPSLHDAPPQPTVLLDSEGFQIGTCETSDHYISCSNGSHDIRKHGVCQIVNTAEAAVSVSNGTLTRRRQRRGE
ncbi:hypothetical protein F5Y18DRAFT_440692 [Xylariaceae sp. FL1019]|nr:hypothetical protein F5Y18DRAFT_440692 [Xylariaceae sp. FL1019]